VLGHRRDYSGELTEFRAALETMTKLAEKDPANSDWQLQSARVRNDVGAALLAQRDYSAALTEFRAA
jgi:hypothetical protein